MNIDIFVYDNAPDDEKIIKQMFDRRDALRNRFLIQNQKGVPSGNIPIRTLKYIRRFVFKLFSGNQLIEKMVENSKRFADKETPYVGNFTAFSRTFCHKRVFADFVDVEFEGKLYKAPIGYDEWLRAFYGDYMQLPPPEKRVSHHSYVAFRDLTKN